MHANMQTCNTYIFIFIYIYFIYIYIYFMYFIYIYLYIYIYIYIYNAFKGALSIKKSLRKTYHDVHFLEIGHNKLMSFFNENITLFASSCISLLQTTNISFALKNKNCCYLCPFYHECAFDLLY